jgi:hypothetical protein
MAPYHQSLKSMITTAHGGIAAWAKAHGFSKDTVESVCQGRRAPPPSQRDAWADALGLDGQERARFIRWASIEKAQRITDATPGMEELRRERDAALAQLAVLEKEVAYLRAQLAAPAGNKAKVRKND